MQLPLYSTVDSVLQNSVPESQQNSIRADTEAWTAGNQSTYSRALLVQQCFVLLCLCRAALEQVMQGMTGSQTEDAPASADNEQPGERHSRAFM